MENEKDKPEKKLKDVDFDTDLHGSVETDATGKNVLIRDPDASIDTSELEILEYSPPVKDEPDPQEVAEEADPYDPYNSGIFNMADEEESKSREWKTKRRK